MLGHLRGSTLQGQLQERRRQGKNLSSGKGKEGGRALEKRACTRQAGSQERADVRESRGGGPQSAGRAPNILAAPTPAVSSATRATGRRLDSPAVRSAQLTPLGCLPHSNLWRSRSGNSDIQSWWAEG